MKFIGLMVATVLLLLAHPTWCLPTDHLYPVPLPEIESLLSSWLSESGMQLQQETTGQGQVILIGVDGSRKWEVVLTPHSALSTEVVAYFKKNGEKDNPDELYAYLDHFPMQDSTDRPVFSKETPLQIHEVADAVVCLQAMETGEKLEFSGFFIDTDIILSTAHGLQGSDQVSVVAADGTNYQGAIVRIDFDRDLALIKVNTKQKFEIALETGRNLLNAGEQLYSVGCMPDKHGVILPGLVAGSPWQVGGQPLWKVEMEVTPGRSGSPVFDEQGAIVAMVKGRYRGTETMGFLIPLQTIMDFLTSYFAECNTDATK